MRERWYGHLTFNLAPCLPEKLRELNADGGVNKGDAASYFAGYRVVLVVGTNADSAIGTPVWAAALSRYVVAEPKGSADLELKADKP